MSKPDPALLVIDTLAALRAAPTDDVPEQTLAPLFEAAVAIVRGDPAVDGPPLIAAAAPFIASAELGIAAYVNRLEDLLTRPFESDEWLAACERRSRIEAVRALWPTELGGDGAPLVSIETVDDLLQQKGQHEGYLEPAKIPPGTPTSHWWWWYPAAPPAA